MQGWETKSGETPIDDITGLIPKGVTTRTQLNFLEAQNILKAVVKYIGEKPNEHSAPFDLSWCLKLHQEMFGDVWEWAGQPRRKDLNLGTPWYNVQADLKNLFDDLRYWEKNWADILEQAVHLHYRSVLIHPFLNGNGRWSRMLSNIWLLLHDHPIVMWPEAIAGGVSTVRKEYLLALKNADNGNMSPLIELHRSFIEKSDPEDAQI